MNNKKRWNAFWPHSPRKILAAATSGFCPACSRVSCGVIFTPSSVISTPSRRKSQVNSKPGMVRMTLHRIITS